MLIDLGVELVGESGVPLQEKSRGAFELGVDSQIIDDLGYIFPIFW